MANSPYFSLNGVATKPKFIYGPAWSAEMVRYNHSMETCIGTSIFPNQSTATVVPNDVYSTTSIKVTSTKSDSTPGVLFNFEQEGTGKTVIPAGSTVEVFVALATNTPVFICLGNRDDGSVYARSNTFPVVGKVASAGVNEQHSGITVTLKTTADTTCVYVLFAGARDDSVAKISMVSVQYSQARKILKGYLGDSNGIARKCYELETTPTIDANTSYIKFSSPSQFYVETQYRGWNNRMEVSTDPSRFWFAWTGSRTTSIPDSTGKYVLYMRGEGNTVVSGGISGAFIFTGSGDITCEGNIETLLDYATVAAGNHPTMSTYCFTSLFVGCDKLVKAPTLPAITLTDYCYASMFKGCTSLTTPPALPATILATGCYANMFDGCTGLSTYVELPALLIPEESYSMMFNNAGIQLNVTGTTSLIGCKYRIPYSKTGRASGNSMTNMFSGQVPTPDINTFYYVDSRTSNIVTRTGEIKRASVYYIEIHESLGGGGSSLNPDPDITIQPIGPGNT